MAEDYSGATATAEGQRVYNQITDPFPSLYEMSTFSSTHNT
ncbi:MAG: hypothetical protein WAZ77_01640 [Candidatus Nitrosopolaris sp.]|jgi:hypothetical protein